MPVEQSHKQISSEKFVMNKDETITKMQKDTEELRKRFDESLKKAMNQPSYHLVKGELSEEEEEDNLAISVQQKTVQEVVASTAKVLLHDERIEPASVEIQMRINNIKGHTRGKAANVHFDAFVRQLLHVLTTITKSALIQKL
uniref:Dynein light chain n=1 Tax=Ascaris lumbricoides TaxID=6252 RepID=A0A0M3I745_ASCLU